MNVVQAHPEATVDATFEIPVTENGARILDRAGVPTPIRGAHPHRTNRLPRRRRTRRRNPVPSPSARGGATFARLVTGDEFQFLYRILEPTFGWLLDQIPEDADQIAGS